VTSPLQRAAATAREIAAVLDVPVELDDRLVELDYGEMGRRRLGEVSAAEWQQWRADIAFAPRVARSLAAVAVRVGEFCAARLAVDTTGRRGEPRVADQDRGRVGARHGMETTWRMQLDVASMTRIGRRADGVPFLAGYNEVGHLR